MPRVKRTDGFPIFSAESEVVRHRFRDFLEPADERAQVDLRNERLMAALQLENNIQDIMRVLAEEMWVRSQLELDSIIRKYVYKTSEENYKTLGKRLEI